MAVHSCQKQDRCCCTVPGTTAPLANTATKPSNPLRADQEAKSGQAYLMMSVRGCSKEGGGRVEARVLSTPASSANRAVLASPGSREGRRSTMGPTLLDSTRWRQLSM